MKQAGISVRNDADPNLMHEKVMIIDGVIVLIGSFNLSKHTEEDNENLIIVKGVYIARHTKRIRREMERKHLRLETNGR